METFARVQISSLRGGKADAAIQNPRRQYGLPRRFAPRNDEIRNRAMVSSVEEARDHKKRRTFKVIPVIPATPVKQVSGGSRARFVRDREAAPNRPLTRPRRSGILPPCRVVRWRALWPARRAGP